MYNRGWCTSPNDWASSLVQYRAADWLTVIMIKTLVTNEVVLLHSFNSGQFVFVGGKGRCMEHVLHTECIFKRKERIKEEK